MSDPVTEAPAPPTTTPPIPVAEFPAATVDRLQSIMQRLLTLRNTFSLTIEKDVLTSQYATIDAMLVDLLQSMREIQTGPSLMDQFAAKLGLELEQRRADADLAMAKQRDAANDATQNTTGSLLRSFFPAGPIKTGGAT